jgi:hypothetical protein
MAGIDLGSENGLVIVSGQDSFFDDNKESSNIPELPDINIEDKP